MRFKFILSQPSNAYSDIFIIILGIYIQSYIKIFCYQGRRKSAPYFYQFKPSNCFSISFNSLFEQMDLVEELLK